MVVDLIKNDQGAMYVHVYDYFFFNLPPFWPLSIAPKMEVVYQITNIGFCPEKMCMENHCICIILFFLFSSLHIYIMMQILRFC